MTKMVMYTLVKMSSQRNLIMSKITLIKENEAQAVWFAKCRGHKNYLEFVLKRKILNHYSCMHTFCIQAAELIFSKHYRTL